VPFIVFAFEKTMFPIKELQTNKVKKVRLCAKWEEDLRWLLFPARIEGGFKTVIISRANGKSVNVYVCFQKYMTSFASSIIGTCAFNVVKV